MSARRRAGVVVGLVVLAAAAALAIAGLGGDDATPEPPAAAAATQRPDSTTTGAPEPATSGPVDRDAERRPDSAGGPEPAPTPAREAERPTPASATGGQPKSEPAPDAAAPSLTKQELRVPEGAHGLVWVRSRAEVPLRTEPDGGRVAKVVDRRTEFGSPTVFGVVKQVRGWAGVTTPYLPNGQLAWVRLDPKRIKAGWTRLSIEVDLSARQAALRRGDRVVRSFAVTIGAPGVETPSGRFAVTDTFRGDLDPAAYGCCALALSATQPHLPSGWLGGNRIAIHGTSGPLGVAASHGCVRAADEDVSALVARVSLGTPVFIRG
jgi:lipoprotein-anchoring transpeptidase ErfK/SrfK